MDNLKREKDQGLDMVDYKILEGYNPDIKLLLNNRQTSGMNQCIFRYITKKLNK